MSESVTYDFSGKTAVVTGGASGLGRAAAQAFAEAGAQVLVVDVDADHAHEVAETLPGNLGRAAVADVTSESDVRGFVAKAVDDFSRIDIFFNNAGIAGKTGDFFATSEEAFDELFAVNVKGVFFGLREVGRHMVEQGGGAIVNTSSTAGLRGKGGVLYSTTKWAVIGLTKTTACTLGPSGVRVNAVCPTATPTRFGGWGETESDVEAFLAPQIAQIPLGRLGKPTDTASAVTWLCSDAAAFVNGAVLAVDGGFSA